ncbi:LicD family protein [Akkermansiaceae bacterium]|nr:LicD family protein [Akkermansiaceae bacterium]
MKELTLPEIKILQQEILDEVHSFCKENNIDYSLSYGTLLGAIRHQGYIPWDDDIDVMIPRPDYDKFVSNFKARKSHFKVKSSEKDKDYPYLFAKVENSKTKLVEYSSISYNIGVNIDIFPIDGLPKKKHKLNNFYRKMDLCKKMLAIKTVKINLSSRGLIKNTTLFFLKVLFSLVSYQLIVKLTNKLVVKYDYSESKFVMSCCLEGSKRNQYMSKVVYDEFIEVVFESKKYKAIKNFDDYLSMQYGNYMELPPKVERITHHNYKAYAVN